MPAPMPEAPMQEAAPAPEEQNPEDAIVDQIGELMQQLSPEKQQAVIATLGEALGGQQSPQGTSSVDGGPNGVPVGV